MQRNTGYFPTESLEPSGNRLFSRSALNEGYLFRGSLTDGTMKYIWYVTSGREQLFDVKDDPGEKNDLSNLPQFRDELNRWRNILVNELAGREEGFSDGTQLIRGCIPQKIDSRLKALMQKRQEEGFKLAFQHEKMPIDNMDYQNDLMSR